MIDFIVFVILREGTDLKLPLIPTRNDFSTIRQLFNVTCLRDKQGEHSARENLVELKPEDPGNLDPLHNILINDHLF